MGEANQVRETHGKQIAPHAKHGGKRAGAGRKPDYFKRLQVKPLTAAEILARYPEDEAWGYFLTHEDPEIRLKARIYLTDRRDGKPRQAVEVSGGIMHAHTVYRDPELAALSIEELQALDSITRKLALPAPDNQTKSDAATNAIDVECGAIDGPHDRLNEG
jgi:hypothetical protein